MKILVVDDCPTTRKLISLYLKSKGFLVVTAENGLDAIEKLGAGDVNMILSDINMPYMDGIEFLKTVRSDPNSSHIPVFMVTTESDPEEKERAFDSGANGYLVKPVTAEQVVSAVKQILKQTFVKVGCDV
ncbi:MAG: response regulator [Nitrospirae bacterium]|jgi:two-component system chemotaxis response regulator CheY|nr:response regulator [Nitrospirota bacterium]